MHSRKPIIYGPDGQPIVRVRDRLAPKPMLHTGLDGWLEWRLIDRRGRAERAGEQHNLFLDAGLDAIATSSAILNGAHFTHCAVGTGSNAPATSDTALDNEIARTSTLIGTRVFERVGDGEYRLTITWEFDFPQANGNLTELAIARAAVGNLSVRELFRDGSGNPITVTKTSDYKLRVTYTLDLALSPTTLTPTSFVITGLNGDNPIDADYMFLSSDTTNSPYPDFYAFAYTANARNGAGLSNGVAGTAAELSGIYMQNLQSSSAGDAALSYNAYVPGSFTRSATLFAGTSSWNEELVTIGITNRIGGSGNAQRMGFGVMIDEAHRFTKDSLHTLTIDDLLTVSWGRA